MKEKSLLQSTWDFIGIPFRLVLFDQNWLPRFGWTTLEDERLSAVLPYIKGRVLDIGAGQNNLVKYYGTGIGVDVFDWGGGALVVENTSQLPFEDQTFDTVTLIACLNHIPYRQAVLREVKRLLKPDGKLIMTMINPFLGNIGHTIWWYDEHKQRGGMEEGEVGGMWKSEIVQICTKEGFELQVHERFVYKMNNLYLFQVKI